MIIDHDYSEINSPTLVLSSLSTSSDKAFKHSKCKVLCSSLICTEYSHTIKQIVVIATKLVSMKAHAPRRNVNKLDMRRINKTKLASQ